MESGASFNYQVVLKPKDIKFTKNRIPSRFDNGTHLKDLLEDIKSGKILCKDISAAEVVWDMDRWEWYTLSNRRLWVFKELEKAGKISFISMSRVETVNDGCWRSTDSTPEFYSEVELYEPDWDITIDTVTKPKGTNSIMAEQKSTTINNKKKSEKVVQDGDDDKGNENNKKRRQSPEKSDEDEWVERVIERKRSKSFSRDDKKLSLSRQSLLSNTSSCSSISRNQRKIDKRYGLHGYGSYNKYKTDYLDKIKAEKKSILKKYKPYQVSSSRSRLSRSSSYGKLSGYSRSFSTNSVYTTESFTSINRESRRSSFSEENSIYTTTTQLERQTRRMRLYSDDIEESKGRSNEIVPYKSSLSRNSSVGSIVPSGAVKLADLYAMWQKRRLSYLRSSRLEITNGVASGYICGLCYKKFETIVDLQQHCEALLHYACITCGKFFSTYASLGQHCQKLRHQKD